MRNGIVWTVVGSVTLELSILMTEAWDSVGTYTHEKITDDAIAQLPTQDYPDLHRFSERLRDGSEIEDAHDLINDGKGDLWGSTAEKWWDDSETNGSRMGVLLWYKDHDFSRAYEVAGYMLHLVQDIDVPAHIAYCFHGIAGVRFRVDGLESYVDGPAHFRYTAGTTPWEFTDRKGYRWNYWLADSEDDDDADHETGDYALENDADDADDEGDPLIVDGPDAYEVPNTSWGTYGYGDHLFGFDRVPGLNQGRDSFLDYPKESIGKEQVKKSFDKTVAKLKQISRRLPPLAPDDKRYGQPAISAKIFGPNKPVEVSLVALENRRPTVRTRITAGEMAIKDTDGRVWDGGPNATNALPWDGNEASLPWKGTFRCMWAGGLAEGELEDGTHTVTMKATDEDGNESEERTRSVKYDKTQPKGRIAVTVRP